MTQEVVVVGGGLAGMVAAYRLNQLGCKVTLYEMDTRLGGKAGSIKVEQGDESYYADHGYHLFPGFYLNTWALIKELDILDNFIASGYLDYVDGQYKEQSPPFLFFYSLIDLLAHSEKQVLPWTISGFIHSRWYYTEDVINQYQDMVLKALSDPTEKISALTVQKMYALWLRYIKIPLPTGTGGGIMGLLKSFIITGICQGSLQERWIFPIQKALENAGVTIHMQHQLAEMDIDVKSNKINGLSFVETPDGQPIENPDKSKFINVDVSDKRVIMAIPQNNFLPLLDNIPFADSTVPFFNYEHLRTNQMMGLDIHLNTLMTEMPPDHIVLVGSKYQSTMIDAARVWKTADGKDQFDHSVFQVVAADTTSLSPLSEKDICKELIDDVLDFKLFSKDQVDYDKCVLQTNFTSPLFMNDIGTHQFRPTNTTDISNLYTAGDWAMSIVDVASMENAVTTGGMVAEAVRKDMGIKQAVPLADFKPFPRWILWIVLILMTPFALVFWLWSMLKKLLGM